ncbi:MAG: hypothetical protein HZC43_04145 [Nitrosomonadales bacterium]|nr:hypothetical protein [Nitrosomonadales bacterium]
MLERKNGVPLGVYPDVPLARERLRDEARKKLAQDIDPGERKKATKAAKADRAANSFEVIAREWFAKHSPNWAESQLFHFLFHC